MKLATLIAMGALVPGAAWAADFSGTWRIDNLFNGASAIITCTLVQAGNALSGSCKPEIPGIAASDLTGTVDGSSAKWGYDVVFNGNPARVDYVARARGRRHHEGQRAPQRQPVADHGVQAVSAARSLQRRRGRGKSRGADQKSGGFALAVAQCQVQVPGSRVEIPQVLRGLLNGNNCVFERQRNPLSTTMWWR